MDDGELAQWLEESYETSFRTAYLILGSRTDAEDAVQEAFLRAWRFRGSLHGTSTVKPWLYRVVVTSCYSILRREIPHRSRRRAETALDGVPAGAGSDPAVEAERSELTQRILDALGALPPALSIPVVLRYYAGLSEREIAVAIGRRPGTVKSRLHEARRRLAERDELRDLLAPELPVEEVEAL